MTVYSKKLATDWRWNHYKKVVNYFKKVLKEEYGISVSIKRIKMSTDYYGYCTKNSNKKFSIRLRKSMDVSASVEVLLHEISHSITEWGGGKEDHSDLWGKNYARMYRLYEKQFEQGKKE